MKFTRVITQFLAIQPILVLVKAQGARFRASCGIFDSAVYCYGGQSGSLSDSTSDSQMFKLNLTLAGDIVNYKNNWQSVNPITNSVVLSPRSDPQTVTVSSTQLLVNGGYNSGTAHKLEDQSMLFDVTTSTWSSYANYVEGDFGNRQIYYATSAFVPGKGAAFYGGFEENVNASWTIDTPQNLTMTLFNDGGFRAVGYTNVAFLDIITNTWTVPSPQINAPTIFSAVQSSIYYPKDQKIYYFGGTYGDTLLPGYKTTTTGTAHNFTYALTFDTSKSVWENQTLSGPNPAPRKFHTTNILPNSPSTVLLYGGEIPTGGLVADFCFTLDMDTFTWTSQSISNTQGTNILRSRHSVIEVNNDSLLIVFGVDSTQTATDELIALNISDINSISYMSYFPGINPALNITHLDDESSKLSTGAIAGIAVGAAVAVIGGAALAIFFCFFKKRKGNQRIPYEDEHPNNSEEQIDVNWDEIEKQYREVPGATRPAEFSTDDSNTAYNNSSEGNGSVSNYNQFINKPHGENQPIHLTMKPDISIS